MLSWNVYYEDFNGRKIGTFNIFYGGFLENCRKAYKKYKDDKEGFLAEVRGSLMYYFWSKCEFEVLLTSWIRPDSETFTPSKVDVYDQIMLNWDRFCDYLWENRKELKNNA